jgi:hypothetical protein
MSSDDELARLLQAVQDGDDADVLADNESLARSLQWPLSAVAACLREAKDRSLIWGMRSSQQPAPWFTDLELTVQGRRFLAARTADHGP